MLRLFLAIAALAVCSFAQCSRADASCAEHLPLGDEGKFSVVYRSYSLTKLNPNIRRALIVIHGSGRNADGYFASAAAGALIGDALEDTLIAAPRIASNTGDCKDTLAPGEISWGCTGADDWRRGGKGAETARTSYDLIDEIVRKAADKRVFPNLTAVVVSGHSAGGQFANRYAATNRLDGKLGVAMSYVVSNPSNYLYIDNLRLPSGECNAQGKCAAEFQPFAASEQCEAFDNWHYGMKNRTGYSSSIDDDEMKRNLIARDVVYLLGELDTLPIGGFDSSCPAMAQGPTRFSRGLTYWNYMRSKHGAQHRLNVVPSCGHNGRCMYTADASMPVLFPRYLR